GRGAPNVTSKVELDRYRQLRLDDLERGEADQRPAWVEAVRDRADAEVQPLAVAQHADPHHIARSVARERGEQVERCVHRAAVGLDDDVPRLQDALRLRA